MQVLTGSTVSLAIEPTPAALPPKVFPGVSTPSPAPAATPALQTASTVQTNGTPAFRLEPLLTFRRDPAGRMYYVITDAQSGKEIAQLPPEQLRNVGEGIAEFLKQQEAKSAANPHIVTKG